MALGEHWFVWCRALCQSDDFSPFWLEYSMLVIYIMWCHETMIPSIG